MIAAVLLAAVEPPPVANGHGTLAIIGAITGVLGVLLGGYAALNAYFSKRAKADELRDSLKTLRDVLATVKADPARVAMLGTPSNTAHVQEIEDNLGKVTSLLLRWRLRRLVSTFSEASRTPPAAPSGQGAHAVQSKVDRAYDLACKCLHQLDVLVRRSPT